MSIGTVGPGANPAIVDSRSARAHAARMTYRTLGVLASCALAGCTSVVATPGDTDGSGDTDGTTSTPMPSTTTTSSDGSSTTDLPTSGADESSGSSGGADESSSTGSPTQGAPARFALRLQDPAQIVWIEYADGDVTQPVDLLPDAPRGYAISTTSTFDDDRFLAACWRVPPSLDTTCGVFDLAAEQPSFASLSTGDLDGEFLQRHPEWVPATRTVWTQASTVKGEDAGVFMSEIVDGTPTPSTRVLDPGEVLSGFAVGPDGSQLTYTHEAEDGGTELYVRSTDPSSEDAPTLFSTPAPDGFRNATVRLLPTHDAVVYAVHYETNLIPNTASLWFVDLSGGTASAPVRIDGDTAAPNRIDREVIAPDEHAMAFWVGPEDDGFSGEFLWVDLSSGSPQPPERISDLSDAAATIVRPQWSPDSRWFGYEADHNGSGLRSLYLVEAAGSSPGTPMQVGDGIAVGDVVAWFFSDDGQWLYVTAGFGQQEPRVFRVDLSGAMPAEPEAIEGPPGWADGEMILSADGLAMLHPAIDGSRSLAWADLSADRLRPSVLVHDPLPRNVDVSFGARFSADTSIAAYGERGDDGLSALRLFDRSTGDTVSVDDTLSVGVIYPAPSRR